MPAAAQRFERTARLFISLLIAAAALAFPAAAAATHNQDEHSANMELLFNSPKAGTGRTTGVLHSDLAFWENLVVAGNYGGFRIFDISNPAAPVLLSDVACNGAQADVAVWESLLFVSVDRPQTALDCSGVNTPGTAPGFEGIRIFDISSPTVPRFVKAVPTDCGSHTHTLVPDLARARILVYVSSYPLGAGLGPSPYGTQCSRANPGHDKISIVEIPLAAPERARVAATPGPFNFPDMLAIPGLRGCHDISVYLPAKIAAGACLSEGVLFDISDPMNPRITHRLVNPAIDGCARRAPAPPANPLCLWHSATFTWDGKYVIWGDEAGGSESPECEPNDPVTRGAFWIHSVRNPTNPLSFFKISRFQARSCTGHLFNVVPINGRYLLASSWNDGGTSVIDWTNPRAPYELGFYDPVLPLPASGILGSVGAWASYWHNDFIFVNDRDRGLDVLRLRASWASSAFDFRYDNPQTQETTIKCTVRASVSRRLRAGVRSTVTASVKATGVAPLLRGQPAARARVKFHGPGILWSATTNARGVARLSVAPTRAGWLRISVPTVPNMGGCETRRRVRAVARPVAPPPIRLTGRAQTD